VVVAFVYLLASFTQPCICELSHLCVDDGVPLVNFAFYVLMFDDSVLLVNIAIYVLMVHMCLIRRYFFMCDDLIKYLFDPAIFLYV
jgi:hypothetical protein